MIRRRTLATAIAGLLAGALPAAHAADYEVTVTNLTSGVHFTPLVLAAHPESASVFESGMPASEALRAVAEGGDTTALAATLESIGAAVTLDDTLLAPGETRTFLVSDGGDPANSRLSIAGMLLPTNDGFVGLDSLALPVDETGGVASPGEEAFGSFDDDVPGDTDGDAGTADVAAVEDVAPADDTAPLPIDPFGEPEPLDETSADEASVDEVSVDGTLADESLDEVPSDETSVEEMPVEETLADATLDEMPVDEMPVDEMSVDEMSVDGTLADESLDVEGSTTDVPVDPTTDLATGEIAPMGGPTSTDDTSITVELLGYDAGTEANDELLGSGAIGEAGFPAPPEVVESGTGTGASGITAPIENFVHVHRGVQGDNDPVGGVSDINAVVHGWMNPVARVTVSLVRGTAE